MKYNKSLTSLDITGNPIEDEGLWSIGGLLLEENCNCQINSISCNTFNILTGSEKITMNDETLGSGATRLMFGVLKFNTLIKVLNLKGRGIETAAAAILAVAVSHNKVLHSIDLSDNPITDVSQYTGDKPKSDTKGLLALAKAVQMSPSVEAITLEGGTLPVDQLKGTKKVRVLDLSRKNLSFVSATFMGTLVSGNHYMNELVVHTNDLTPNGAKIIVKQLTTTMKTIDIANVVRVEERVKGDKKGDKKLAAQNAAARADIPPAELEAMWSAISELTWLEKLTLDRDHLSALPNVGKLVALKTLSVSNNKLSSLPDDISLIRGLKSLTLHGNQLSELNAAVGDLEFLEKLDLRLNKLLFLPTTISKLRNLKQLDVSENLLQTLDPSLCDLHTIEKAEFKDNPLVRPPMAICRQGLGAVRKFFQEIVTSADIKSHAARVVLLGHTDSGKTCMQKALRAHVANVPLKATIGFEPTNHVDIESVALGEGTDQVLLSIWDLSGHREAASGIQQYITDGSFFMLVVPATDMAMLKNNSHDYVGRWLSYLQLKAPTAIVIPVLAKCDTIKGAFEAGSPDRSTPVLENAAKVQLEWFNEQLDAFEKLHEGTKSLRLQRPVQCISSSASGDVSIGALKTRVEQVLSYESKLLPHVGQLVTRNHFLTSVFIRAVRDGREPIDSARAADIGYIPSTMSAEHKSAPRPFITFNDLREMYINEFVPTLKLSGADDRMLTDILKLMSCQGECLMGVASVIFLDRNYITRILKPLTDSRMGNRLWVQRTLAAQDALRALMSRSPLTDSEKVAIANSAEWLEKTGEVHEELFLTLWDNLPARKDAYGQMLTILSASGLLYLADNSEKGGRKFMLPSRTPTVKIEEAKERWTTAIAENSKASSIEVVALSMTLGRVRPVSLIDSLMSSCSGLGSWVSQWKSPTLTGAHIKPQYLPGVADLLIELREVKKKVGESEEFVTEFELAIECVAPKSQRTKSWAAVMHVKSLAQAAIDDLPGLVQSCRTVFVCPACLSAKEAEPSTWAVEEIAAKSKQCEKTGEQISLQSVALGFAGRPYLLHLEPALNQAPRELKFCADKLRLGRPLETVLSLYAQLGLSATEDIDVLRQRGIDGIIDEIIARPDPARPSDSRKPGWSSLEWLRYLAGDLAENAVQAASVAAGSKALEAEDAAKAASESQERLRRQAKESGIDAGRDHIDLSSFVKNPLCAAAGLNRGHVLALRLFGSRMNHAVNMSLHHGVSPERPHPYPTLVIMLNDAVWKLRAAQIEQRRLAKRKVETLSEAVKKAKDEGDDEKLVQYEAELKDAIVHAKSLDCFVYWRGIANMPQNEFKLRGATEVGFMSVSKSRAPAQEATHTTANSKHLGTTEDEDEETVYLALAPEWKSRARVLSPVEGAELNDDGTEVKAKKTKEIPILMLNIQAPTDKETPADISFLSAWPEQCECVYAPGAFMDMGKVNTEYMEIDGEANSPYRVADITITLGRNLSSGKSRALTDV